MKKSFNIFVFIILCVMSNFIISNDRLLLIDTGFNDFYAYNNFLLLAKSVGFRPDYKQFYEVTEASLAKYGCIVINLDGNFVYNYFSKKNEKITSPVIQKIVDLLDSFKKQKNKLLGIMLPSKMGDSSKDTYERALMITQKGLHIDDTLKKPLSDFLHNLMVSDHHRSFDYHTSLLPKNFEPHKRSQKLNQNCSAIINEITNTLIAGPLPLDHAKESPPLAWYGSNGMSNGHFFITKTSLMTFADIGENFIYNPLDFSLRLKRLEEVQQLLHELFRATLLGKFSKSSCSVKPSLPLRFTKKFVLDEKKRFSAQRKKEVNKNMYDWADKEMIWCGFSTIDVYNKKEEEAAKSLLRAHFNMLWLQLGPEWYLSKFGVKKNDKNKFFDDISRLTKALQKVSLQSQEKVPRIFMGTEMTGNFSQRSVKNPVVDVYGEVYTKVPSPFDFKNLWKMELLDVFDRFYDRWPKISHSIPLAGIFLDFEMYHAKDQTAHYTTLMDFSDYAWNIYCDATHQQKLKKMLTVDERIGYLMDHGKCKDYFKQLEKQAYHIGKQIKDHIRKKLPNAIIAIYDIYLPHTWFYKGIMAGLSSPQEPIILATFNNDFYSNYAWLKKNNIYAYHLLVLLLSKFQKLSDFDLIKKAAGTYHDGAWFNRVSRLEESRDPKEWAWDYGVETTPLDTKLVVEEMRKQFIKIQKNLLFNCADA